MKPIKKLVIGVIGRERANTLSAPYYDWRARARTRKTLGELPSAGLNVNIGCGPRPMSGWINLDHSRGDGVDIVWDLNRGLPFHAESCSALFCEHVIEHLSRNAADIFLKECYRVLQPSGILRLSTPDASLYLNSYCGDGEFLRHSDFAVTVETPLDRINIMMRQDGQHLWAYDGESLKLTLSRAGFVKIFSQGFGISRHPRMRSIDAKDREFESFYMEAEK